FPQFPSCIFLGNVFQHMGEKQLHQEIIFITWYPKRYPIALVKNVGDVLFDLVPNIQQVWSLPPIANMRKEVISLTWETRWKKKCSLVL
uniref:Uncharacterized protein n=1 Tax=Monodelphis domestica TaxID=13616 RepID=A0A5F8HF72_MONDO